MASMNQQNAAGAVSTGSRKCWLGKLMNKVVEFPREGMRLAKGDPRRIIHSFKVGLAISLVSLFYYFDDPLYEGFGVSAMWAVITVVVVFEFSVGATLGRGVNRGVATLSGGALGIGAHHLATLSGEKYEPLLLGLSCFLLAAMVTFLRFFPKMKARYDYGFLILILTFSLISVSAYRDDQVLLLARIRLTTILVGGTTAIAVCVLILPAWAGNDLHNLLASNLEKLGTFLEGFGSEYFKMSKIQSKEKKASLEGYKSVLSSQSTEETLANAAKWEPHHGHFRYRHPWDKYLKVCTLIRQCAYRIDSLNGHLNSETQVPIEIQAMIQESYTMVSSKSGHVLKELALAIRTMTWPSSADSHIASAKMATEKLKSLLKITSIWEDANVLELVPVAAVASMLIDIVTCIEKITESIKELASLARFKVEKQPTVTQEPSKSINPQMMQPSSSNVGNLEIIIFGGASGE